jgi:predicted 3-demethylubiquinone-9 3-methyltransferase (glyoxalase superfamily)
MALAPRKITPCLWMDEQAEEAANFYVSIFKNSKIGRISRYSKEGFDIHGGKAGSVMTVEFELDGQPFVALNGGPQFKFTEAVSFQIYCADQNEIDYFWSKLTEGGSESVCGWLKDKYGLSWQVVPSELIDVLTGPDAAKAERATKAFLQMKKFDLAKLRQAYNG